MDCINKYLFIHIYAVFFADFILLVFFLVNSLVFSYTAQNREGKSGAALAAAAADKSEQLLVFAFLCDNYCTLKE